MLSCFYIVNRYAEIRHGALKRDTVTPARKPIITNTNPEKSLQHTGLMTIYPKSVRSSMSESIIIQDFSNNSVYRCSISIRDKLLLF